MGIKKSHENNEIFIGGCNKRDRNNMKLKSTYLIDEINDL